MKRFLEFTIVIAIGLVLIGLTGCTPAQIKADVEAKVAHDFAVAVTPVAKLDLEKAAATATAHGDAAGATCATEVLNYLNAVAASPAPADPFSGIVGIATAIEAQRIAASATPVALPPVPQSLVQGCAVVVFELKVSFAQFLAQLGFDVANLRVGGAIGSAKTLSLVKAAEAAQAVKP
jgi:hypothetical protein